MTSRRVVGLLLAAGEGSRLGRPKALVEYGGRTWLARTVETLQDAGVSDIYVVVGAAMADVVAAMPAGCRVVESVDWREGMGASLRAGLDRIAAEEPTADAVVVMLVDTPGVTTAVVDRLLASVAPNALVRAAYDGRPRHPVLLGRDHWRGVVEVARGDEGARAYLRSHHAALVECGDLGSGEDVDSPEQLAQWRIRNP